MSLCRALTQQLQTALGEIDHLNFVIILANFDVRLGVTVGNLSDNFDNILRFNDETNELLILRLNELEDGPDRNVLERRVTASKESAKITMNTVARFCPALNKDGVVAD